MRQIETHRSGTGQNELVMAEVADVIEEDERKGKVASKYQFYIKTGQWEKSGRLEFQRGPWRREKDDDPPAQPNGVSDEAVLAVLMDHLHQQNKAKETPEVTNALKHLDKALACLKKRQ